MSTRPDGQPVLDPRPTALGAASVVLDEGGRVLLVHHTYGELNWEIPGGGGEPHESAEETAMREAREEVGVELHDRRLTGVYWEPGWRDGLGLHHFVFRAILAPGSVPRPSDPDEISECGWFALDALPRPLSSFTAQRIEDALSDRPVGVFVVSERRWLD